MASSTLKAVILVAAVVVGVILLRGAFPESTGAPIGSGAPTGTGSSPGGSVSPSVSASVSLRPEGSIRVQVLNGTSVLGLAADVTLVLRGDGYKMAGEDNAPTTNKTIVYYQDGYRADAVALAEKRFPGARVRAAPGSVLKRINIQVILGEDYQPS
jgi:hypothetical protein